MIPFLFNENRFFFLCVCVCVADHLLVSQLCTNPKSDRSLLSCLKVTQYSTNEIGDAPHSCTLPIQLMTTGSLPAPSKCKPGRFNVTRAMKTKFPATVMVFGVVSSEGHIMPPHIFEVSLKVNTKVYLDVLKSVVIPWCNQLTGGRPRVWQQDSAPAHKSNETQAWFQNWTRWTTLFGHMSTKSPTWPPTTPKAAWSPPSTEYTPSSHRRLWKRHASSSESVSRWRLRLKVATLTRCQLYYIIKLPELIFFNKSFKIRLWCCFL